MVSVVSTRRVRLAASGVAPQLDTAASRDACDWARCRRGGAAMPNSGAPIRLDAACVRHERWVGRWVPGQRRRRYVRRRDTRKRCCFLMGRPMDDAVADDAAAEHWAAAVRSPVRRLAVLLCATAALARQQCVLDAATPGRRAVDFSRHLMLGGSRRRHRARPS